MESPRRPHRCHPDALHSYRCNDREPALCGGSQQQRHRIASTAAISSQILDYAAYIRDMQDSFAMLDTVISGISLLVEGGSIDSTRVKAIFYSLFFGAENLQMDSSDYRAFADCFVRYETRTRTVDNGDGTTSEEEYTVAVPIKPLPEIYANLETALGRTITYEEQANASEIYHHILYGGSVPTHGEEFDAWVNGLPLSDAPFTGVDGFCSPLGENWRSMVTSEFGYRTDPFTGQRRDIPDWTWERLKAHRSVQPLMVLCCLCAIRTQATAIIWPLTTAAVSLPYMPIAPKSLSLRGRP